MVVAQLASRLASSFAIAPADSVRLRASTTGRYRSSACGRVEQGYEVDGVLGHDDSVLGGHAIEHLVVGTAGEAEVADVLRVMPEIGQVPGDYRAEHLVDEEPHEARKRSRSRAACSARSAAASLRSIVDSTSSGWAAANDTAERHGTLQWSR